MNIRRKEIKNLVFIILILIPNTLFAQGYLKFGTTLSIRTPNQDVEMIDREITLSIDLNGQYYLWKMWEVENRNSYNGLELKMDKGYLLHYYRKTAQDIDYLKFGYRYEYSYFKFGIVGLVDHWKDPEFALDSKFQWKSISLLYLRSPNKFIIQADINYDINKYVSVLLNYRKITNRRSDFKFKIGLNYTLTY